MRSKTTPQSNNGKRIYQTSWNQLREGIIIISRTRIRTWRAMLIVFFAAGFASALTLAVSQDWMGRIFGAEKQITNIAQVVYEDADGKSYGPSASKTLAIDIIPTPDATPPANISDLRSSDIAQTSIKLIWTAPGDDGNTGTASAYDIRYSDKDIKNDTDWNNAVQVSGEPLPQVAGTEQSYIATNLQTNTNYYFAIKTADEAANWSGLSNIVKEKTSSEKEKISKIKIKFRLAGAKQHLQTLKLDVLVLDTADIVETNEAQSNNQGVAEITVQNTQEGQYDLLVAVKYHLSKKLKAVSLEKAKEQEEIDFGELIAGNLQDSDNEINSLDWTIMSQNWGKKYLDNNKPEVDINQDNIVNSLDWSLMQKNWGKKGD